MGKYIAITKDTKEYVMEFDRASIIRAENEGFDAMNMGNDPMNDFMKLLTASLYKNQPDMTDEEICKFADYLINEGYSVAEMSEELVKLYTEVFQLEGGKKKFKVQQRPPMVTPKLVK